LFTKILASLSMVAAVFPLAASSQPAARGPHFESQSQEYYFAPVLQGRKVAIQISFMNSGTGQLEIKGVRTSCSCVTVTPTEKLFLPGRRGTLKVKIETDGLAGEVSENIWLSCNDTVRPLYVFTLRGFVIPEIELIPEQLHFHTHVGAAVTKRLDLLTLFRAKVRICDVEVSAPYLAARIGPADAVSASVLVSLTPSAPGGWFREHVRLTTDDAAQSEFKVPVTGYVQSGFLSDPEAAFFSLVRKGSSVEREITIKRRDHSPFSLEVATTDGGIFDARVSGGSCMNSMHTVCIRVSEAAPVGPIRGEVHLKTGDAIEPVLSIPVFGVVTEVRE